MNVIYLLLPITLTLVALFLAGYFWATIHGQYDDLDTPPHRILLDEKPRKDSHL